MPPRSISRARAPDFHRNHEERLPITESRRLSSRRDCHVAIGPHIVCDRTTRERSER
jgi:hypothetical protein